MPKTPLTSKHAEKVMVVARSDIFAGGIWHGIKSDNLTKYIRLISTKHKFLPRGEVEEDARWQQIIPYIVFENAPSDAGLRSIFVMQRTKGHTDQRLASNYSLGIGGHINAKDVTKGSKGTNGTKGANGNEILEWAKREFEEEVNYSGKFRAYFVGLLNDDSNDVGLVHLGLVIKVVGDGGPISIRDEHKSGEMVGVGEAGKYYKNMETWSRIVYDFLNNKSMSSNSSRLTNVRSNNISGILPDWVIEDYISKGVIGLTPLDKNWKQMIDQVSIDFHLGRHLKLFKGGTYRFIDTRRGLPEDAMEEINLSDGDPFILEPGAFAIAATREVLKLPADILGRLEGKSSLARLGILVHSTAARFDPGWNGAPVLELGNLGPKPAILYCGMPICAFTFEKLSVPVRMKYEGSRSDRYSGSSNTVASKIDQAVNLKVRKVRKVSKVPKSRTSR